MADRVPVSSILERWDARARAVGLARSDSCGFVNVTIRLTVAACGFRDSFARTIEYKESANSLMSLVGNQRLEEGAVMPYMLRALVPTKKAVARIKRLLWSCIMTSTFREIEMRVLHDLSVLRLG